MNPEVLNVFKQFHDIALNDIYVKDTGDGFKIDATVDVDSMMGLLPKIKKVVFNPPATVVFWTDRTKTVVIDTDGNWENVKKANKSKRLKKLKAWKEEGILNAIAKKYYKNYQDDVSKWIEE